MPDTTAVKVSSAQERTELTVRLKQTFGDVPDLMIRQIGPSILVYIAGLVDQQRIERELIVPLQMLPADKKMEILPIRTPSVQQAENDSDIIEALLSGMAAVTLPGYDRVLLANVSSAPHREISEPGTETVIQGPRESFTEVLDTNIALVRRTIKSESLRMKSYTFGSKVIYKVRILFMDGITDPKLVEELSRRMEGVKLDGILESNYLAETLKERPLSMFPTIQHSERPDVVCTALLKGKVAIISDNSPFALIAPFTFWEAFQSVEDSYIMYSSATFLRFIRSLFIMLALLLPSLYVAISTYHVEMMPTNLLLSLAGSREHAPFPAMVEAMIMESVFEALREAIVRLPRILGQAVSVVGALVIGQAIVQAGVVSIPMIIVVSITGIASLMIPRYEMSFAIRILRIMLLLLAGTFGLFGIAIGIFFTQVYLTGLRSFGTPYLSPIVPFHWKGMMNLLIRKPYGKKSS